MSTPQSARQPLVGIALAAVVGIVLAEYFPAPLYVACGAVALLAIVLAWARPGLIYVLVTAGFFALHLAHQVDAPGG